MALRPAHDVYHRLRWDPAIDETTAEVVVLDRKRGPVALPFAAFDPQGDIPFSRVVGFRLGGEVIWDREARIDRVFGTGATPGASLERGTDPPPAHEGAVRVLTLNVLFDRYDRDIVQTERRTPKLLALLHRADADLVALQEVEPWLCQRLLAEPFVAEQYAATDPGDGSTVVPYGQLLLSKAPLLGSEIVRLQGDKRHVLASVALGVRTRVAVVHLSSDRHADAPERRARQLAALRPRLGPGPVLVFGDVNHDGPVDLPLDDAWLRCHPDDPGYTWDPARNALARHVSRTGARRRLDRILVRGFDVDDVELVGVDASDVPVSDHYGLLGTLQPATVAPRARAWVIPLPPAAAAVLEPLRRRFDPGRFRWPGHLTLALDPQHAPSAGQRASASDSLGRRLTLARTTELAGPPRRTVATPDDVGVAWVRGLRETLGFDPDGLPHVTLGEADEALERALHALLPLTFPVDRIERWERTDDGPMRVAEVIGPSPVPSFDDVLDVHGLSAEPTDEPAPLIAAIGAATGEEAQQVGSAILGAQLPEGDLDLVLHSTSPARAHGILRRRFGGTTTSSDIPVTRWTMALGVPPLPRRVDVTVVSDSAARDPGADWAAVLTALGPDHTRGARVLRAVKGWATARQVHDPAFGFLPGLAFAWAVADARSPGDDTDDAWFVRALQRLREAADHTDDRYRALRLPAITAELVEEIERALICAWDGAWSEVFASAHPDAGPGLHLDLRGPPATHEALAGWLRGRIGTVLTALAEGTPHARLRPYPRPVRRRAQTLRFTVRWAHLPPDAVTRAVADLHERFRRSADRPADTELEVTPIDGP